jgi:ABC-type proline/glycine betaine transport system substrate-binding protein
MSFLSNPELGGLTHEEAATKWLADNEDVWMPWTSAGM